MKLSPRITDALPLIKFLAVAAAILAGVFWFNGLLDAKQQLRIQAAEENAIDFTRKQIAEATRVEQARAAEVKKDQDAKIAALQAKLGQIDTTTKRLQGQAKTVIDKNPMYKEQLDPDGIALWQAARDRASRKGEEK